MRPIKFQIRRKAVAEDEDYSIWETFDFKEIPNTEFYFSPNLYDFSTWRQFTGLLDKDGLEIYEGDVVKAKTGNNKWTNREVVFQNLAFRFADAPTSRLTNEGKYEVIGNIYEHSHLLEETQKAS